MSENKILLEEHILEEIAGGGYTEEWAELKSWAVRHNPEWADRDPSEIKDGPVIRWLFVNVPEYDGSAHHGDEPTDYFVKGQSKTVMNHEEFMALIRGKYGD